MVQPTITHPTLLASSSLWLDLFYALDGSLFHPSIYFSVINTTLWSLLFDELLVDILPSMYHTSFGIDFYVVYTTLWSLSFDELQVCIHPSMSHTSFGL